MVSGCVQEEIQNKVNNDISVTRISGNYLANIGINEHFKLTTESNKPGNISYDIFWGDGIHHKVINVSQESEIFVKHAWMDFGLYAMKVNTIFGIDGTMIQTVKQISVENN